MRCIKRNIGHLCHDEPRDADSKKGKAGLGNSTAEEIESQSEAGLNPVDQGANTMAPPSFDGTLGTGPGQAAQSSFDAAALAQGSQMQLVQPTPVSGIQGTALGGNMNQCRPYHSSANLTARELSCLQQSPASLMPG